MRTESHDGDVKVRHWWQYIGPWPLRPWVAGLVVGGLVLVASSSYVPANVVRNFLIVIPAALVPAIGAAVGVAVGAAVGAAVEEMALEGEGRTMGPRLPRTLRSAWLT